MKHTEKQYHQVWEHLGPYSDSEMGTNRIDRAIYEARDLGRRYYNPRLLVMSRRLAHMSTSIAYNHDRFDIVVNPIYNDIQKEIEATFTRVLHAEKISAMELNGWIFSFEKYSDAYRINIYANRLPTGQTEDGFTLNQINILKAGLDTPFESLRRNNIGYDSDEYKNPEGYVLYEWSQYDHEEDPEKDISHTFYYLDLSQADRLWRQVSQNLINNNAIFLDPETD